MTKFDLVIFDCDGVLVDSERLAVRTESKILSELGWPLTEAEIVERFVGGYSATYMQQEIEQHLGRTIDWDLEFEPRYLEVFERELVAVPGIVEALDEINIPVCVASSGSHEKMRFTLGMTGLLDRFDGCIFSVDQVEHGKPAPDIFLFAAGADGYITGSVCRCRGQCLWNSWRVGGGYDGLRICRGCDERRIALDRGGCRLRRHESSTGQAPGAVGISPRALRGVGLGSPA